MITIHSKSNILDITEGFIFHGVNCTGGFGSGIAGQIAKKWPKVKERHRTFGRGAGLLGKIEYISITELPFLEVINCYTQVKYGNTSPYNGASQHFDYKAFRSCLSSMLDHYREYDKVPPYHTVDMIGCGLAGGDRGVTLKILEEFFGDSPNLHLNIHQL